LGLFWLVLLQILKTLKATFWPFQSHQSSSLFLNAVAANHHGPGTLGDNQTRSHGNIRYILLIAYLILFFCCIFYTGCCWRQWHEVMSILVYSAIEMAAAKAAQHRLMRGVWTNVRFGDMRRALAGSALFPQQLLMASFISCTFLVSACERLILLQHDPHELRDYAALLYHCGYYEECLHYLSSYQTAMVCLPGTTLSWEESRNCRTHVLHAVPFQAGQSLSNRLEILEDEAVNTLRARVTLILAEDGWSSRRPAASYWTKNSEPW